MWRAAVRLAWQNIVGVACIRRCLIPMLRVQPTAAQQSTCLALDDAYIPLCAAIRRVCIGGRLLVLYALFVQETHNRLTCELLCVVRAEDAGRHFMNPLDKFYCLSNVFVGVAPLRHGLHPAEARADIAHRKKVLAVALCVLKRSSCVHDEALSDIVFCCRLGARQRFELPAHATFAVNRLPRDVFRCHTRCVPSCRHTSHGRPACMAEPQVQRHDGRSRRHQHRRNRRRGLWPNWRDVESW
mmetsp:Transcript_27834/g.82550  ORF Transcript_27834/g.82550 Transcript_27834/m.82550 type:complete len:242 (+) Transcript_27834:1116-1841(+)